MQPGSCSSDPSPLDVVSAFQSYGKFLEEGSTEAAEKKRYDVVRNSCRKEGGSCGGMYTAKYVDSLTCAESLLLAQTKMIMLTPYILTVRWLVLQKPWE
jgi:dihydroxy-acid dehydratase